MNGWRLVRSKWFPVGLAAASVLRHAGLLGWDYWWYARAGVPVGAYWARDLQRPLFEAYGFCGVWVSYPFGFRAALGFDLPAYWLGAVFVAIVWFVVGLSVRRMAEGRWRFARPGLVLGLVLVPVGGFLVLFSALAVWASGLGAGVQLCGAGARLKPRAG